ncbi:DNA/RNA non-specific endonuclease [Kitasatospora kazusensis]|uniref:DNA/RNA non-specific endonuclease n=1 Tax=Kitasatospora kazusensis TaxID=407974 RepID=UPI0031DBDA81
MLWSAVNPTAQAVADTVAPPAAIQRGSADLVGQMPQISSFMTTLPSEISSYNQRVTANRQQEKDLEAENQSLTQQASATNAEESAVLSEETALGQKANDLTAKQATLNARIDAHNANPVGSQAYNSEADELNGEVSQLDALAGSIGAEQTQLDARASSLAAQESNLNTAMAAHRQKDSARQSEELQLEAMGQQLLQEIAEALQGLAVDGSPQAAVASMAQGGDAARPQPQADPVAGTHGVDSQGGDTPTSRPQRAAIQEYAKRTGATVETGPGTAYLTPAAIAALPPAQASQLGTPTDTYDALVRETDGTYTALKVLDPGAVASPRQTIFSAAARRTGTEKKNGGMATVIVAGKRMTVKQFVAFPGASPLPAGGTASAPPSPNSKADCLKNMPTGARLNGAGGGWILNTGDPVPARNKLTPPPTAAAVATRPGTRAGPATACLAAPLGKGSAATKSKSVTGYWDAQAQAPGVDLARCHLIADLLGGQGWYEADWTNLFLCYQVGLNTSAGSMRSYEDEVDLKVKDLARTSPGAAVLYKVAPKYDHPPTSTIPSGVTISAEIQYPDGTIYPLFYGVSLLNLKETRGPNLGN